MLAFEQRPGTCENTIFSAVKPLESNQQLEIEKLLKDLQELLQAYSPRWYHQRLDDGISAALQMLSAARLGD
jgi:hypothetical protein